MKTQIKYGCGHMGPTGDVTGVVFGTVLSPAEKLARCPTCFQAFLEAECKECCNCGRAIPPGPVYETGDGLRCRRAGCALDAAVLSGTLTGGKVVSFC